MYCSGYIQTHCQKNKKIKRADQILTEVYGTTLNDKNIFTFCRFRTCNDILPIEIGHWTNVERHNRLCQPCQSREIGDEFHYV